MTRSSHSLAFAGSLTMLALSLAGAASAAPVSFKAADGVTVFGDLQEAKGTARATILLFHMAGSNAAEYEPIAPILNEAGFTTLAIDQRSGGTLWGRDNQTAAHAGRDYNFAGALPDLEGAVELAKKEYTQPVIIWGSSYSSALVFLVAAKHPEVRGLLAFSPAEYIAGHSIASAASNLQIPVFITSAPNADEIDSAKRLAKAVPDHLAVQYVPKQGVHGSSTLREDEDPSGSAANWQAVKSFLDRSFPAK